MAPLLTGNPRVHPYALNDGGQLSTPDAIELLNILDMWYQELLDLQEMS